MHRFFIVFLTCSAFGFAGPREDLIDFLSVQFIRLNSLENPTEYQRGQKDTLLYIINELYRLPPTM